MSFASLIKYYASNSQDAIDNFKDIMVSGGWSLYDDLSGGSPYSYVLTSSGTSGEEWPAYLKISEGSNRIDFDHYVYWDNSAHTGNIKISYNEYIAGSSSPFYIWCSASENSAAFDSYISSQHQTTFFCLLNSFDAYAAFGVTQSGVSSGSDVVLQLGSGEADRFVVGTSYQIVGTNAREFVEISAVDKALDRLTISSLSYSFDAGSRIGVLPHRWGLWRYQSWRILMMDFDGTGDVPNYANGSWTGILNRGYIDPDTRTQKYPMTPHLVYGYGNSGLFGYVPLDQTTNWLRCYINTNHELPVSVGNLDTGTSSGSNTTTTLNDTSKSWTTNEFSDKVLIITAGPGVGQFRRIVSNTGTELTITEAFDTLPTDLSDYTICEEGWQYLYSFNSYDYCGAMRVM
jgi:hypothetical protein